MFVIKLSFFNKREWNFLIFIVMLLDIFIMFFCVVEFVFLMIEFVYNVVKYFVFL